MGNPTSLSERTVRAGTQFLEGAQGSLSHRLALVGPAVVASIAYMDPGNIATNIQAGAEYGYSLLSVVFAANIVAMLFQASAAKLGIVTGKNLAELCRSHFSAPVVIVMWITSEVAVMATDLAEFLGAAVGLALLFALPLIVGMLITAVLVYGILLLEERCFRRFEIVIAAFIAAIAMGFVAELFLSPIDLTAAVREALAPPLSNGDALSLAAGIVGATVMPHAIFLHSGLTKARIPTRNIQEKRKLVKISNTEVAVALSVAGVVNIAMVVTAAAAFHNGHSDVAEIETAYKILAPLLGKSAATFFLVSLLASGLSSSVVGTLAGQMVMQGFIGFRVPMWLRRLVTVTPTFIIVGLGATATDALVWSQVVLSMLLPFPMVVLLFLTRRSKVMGEFRSRVGVHALNVFCAIVICCLNIAVILHFFLLI